MVDTTTTDAAKTTWSLNELRDLVRQVVQQVSMENKPDLLPGTEDLLDLNFEHFPVDDLIPLHPAMTFSREEMYGDDGR